MANPPLRFSEWYEVNGYPLATYGYAIESVNAGMPAKRGQNIVAPMQHGNLFQAKRFDTRSETWTMWVCDANPDTGAISSTNAGKNNQFVENMRIVNQIFSDTRSTLEIKKIWDTGTTASITNVARNGSNVATITTSTAHGLLAGDTISVTMENAYSAFDCYGAVVTAVGTYTVSYANTGSTVSTTAATGTLGIFGTLQAEAEYISAIQVNDFKSLKFSTFNIEMIFNDPRWYSIHKTTAVLTLSAAKSVEGTITKANIGSAPVTYMTIDFAPSSAQTFVEPKLINKTYTGSELTIGSIGTVSSMVPITIDTENLTVKSGASSYAQDLYRSGSTYDWFVLYPNTTNTLRFEVSSSGSNTSGTVTLTYKKAYFI